MQFKPFFVAAIVLAGAVKGAPALVEKADTAATTAAAAVVNPSPATVQCGAFFVRFAFFMSTKV